MESSIHRDPSAKARRAAAPAVKRVLDVLGASLAALVLSPVMALTAIAIWGTQGRPILFRQVRPGLGGAPFTMLKFRTMRPPRPDEVWYLTDDARMTRLGKFVRSTSIDELPELWNVIRGDMSLVGPRPLLVEYLGSYTPEEQRRHQMRPGITGWAVVNGRNSLKFRDRLTLDVWYVDHWSLRLDARILAMTVTQVLRRTGVSTSEDLTLGFPLPGLADGEHAETDARVRQPDTPRTSSPRAGACADGPVTDREAS